jgi:hypothetical protein
MGRAEYSQQNVMCAILCVFVITLILGVIAGWISCHKYEMNQEKIEIKDHMKYHKSQGDYMNIMNKFNKERMKEKKSVKAEGSMHSQDPRAGDNRVISMNSQSGEDPDLMMVNRMAPPDLEISQDRNANGRDTPYDRRHIDAIADDPDEAMMQSFESPFASWRSGNNAAGGVNWS